MVYKLINKIYHKIVLRTNYTKTQIAQAFPILEQYSINKQDDNDFIFPEMKMVNLNESKDVFRKVRV